MPEVSSITEFVVEKSAKNISLETPTVFDSLDKESQRLFEKLGFTQSMQSLPLLESIDVLYMATVGQLWRDNLMNRIKKQKMKIEDLSEACGMVDRVLDLSKLHKVPDWKDKIVHNNEFFQAEMHRDVLRLFLLDDSYLKLLEWGQCECLARNLKYWVTTEEYGPQPGRPDVQGLFPGLESKTALILALKEKGWISHIRTDTHQATLTPLCFKQGKVLAALRQLVKNHEAKIKADTAFAMSDKSGEGKGRLYF